MLSSTLVWISRCLVLLFGVPWWFSGKESAFQCRRRGFNPWVKKIPWKKKWQPPPVFLLEKSHGQRSLVVYSPWSWKRVRHNWATKQWQVLLLTPISSSCQSVSLASHFPQQFLSLSIINTNMKQCPFSLISLKNILHETLLRGYHSAWCGRQLKISRSVCVLVCPGWFCFWGVFTGPSSSLTPASHRWMGPSLDTLTSAPGSHFGSLPFTEPLNSSSPLFPYTEYEASLVECAFSSRNILTFHILKTIKNPLKSPLLQPELAARTSSSACLSITCIIAVHFL